ncbi:MAG: hypothetical protein IPK07_06725 [Deltaproteobacteria bacterium]|jgi:hypothetical protein|nr:hypothetical protein [Deltaproteobacteria bacterium]
MSYADFQRQYEIESEKERAGYDREPIGALLGRIRARRLGGQYQLWYAIAARASLAEAGWLLFDFVSGDAEYLDRYHAANALLALLGWTDLEAADLTVAHRSPEKHLAAARGELERRIGARSDADRGA